MVRLTFLTFLILLAAYGCGRSTPYTYPPPPPGMIKPETIKLPDGGLAILLPDAGLEPYVPDAGPTLTCKPIESQTFTLPPKDKKPIDVLFVIDDSASMKNDQEAVAANFKSFISSFVTNQVDFQLGAVTTDMVKVGRRGELVLAGTPPRRFLVPAQDGGMGTLQKDFDEMVNVGVNGSPDEKGLAAARAALSPPLATDAGVNRGFLRANADLGIVFVADEDDHDTRDVASFVTFFKSLKPDIAALSVSAIALQNGIICNTTNWRYVQVARAFGPRGLVSSCTPNYAETLKAIGGRLVGSHCVIGLKRWLEDGARVHVTVNGTVSGFIPYPPDEAYPNGSIQVLTCPAGGGTVELVYEECIESL